MRRDEIKLGDQLKKLFNSGQANEAYIDSKIKRYWAQEMEAIISERTKSIDFKAGTVTIAVSSAPLRNQLLQNREIIIYKMNKYLGSDQVTAIKLL